MSERDLHILHDLAAAFRNVCCECDGIPEQYEELYHEACVAVRPITMGQPAIVPPTPTVPRAVADRLAEQSKKSCWCQ